jgi:copper(I)-binding protein
VTLGIGSLRWLAPVLAAGALACSGTPRIEIVRPEAKLSPALVGVCAVFLHIANAGDGADALVGARVEVPGAVAQLHAMRDGRMVESDRLVVPARGALELRPGGPHIMVFHLPEGDQAACELGLVLRFETSGDRRMSVRLGGPRCG